MSQEKGNFELTIPALVEGSRIVSYGQNMLSVGLAIGLGGFDSKV